MSTRPHLDDPQIAIRYLSDKLSSSEHEAFEAHYLAHPKIVEAMELDAKFKAGLICLRNSGELTDRAIVSERRWVAMSVALAASLLIAVVATLTFRYVVPEAVLASSAAALRRPLGPQLAVVATYKLIPTRAGLFDAVIPLPVSPRAIRLQMVLDIEPPVPPLRVSMVASADDGSRRELVALHQLRADEDGIVILYLNSAAVSPGIYELSVFREDMPAATAESTFTLKVTPGAEAPSPRSP